MLSDWVVVAAFTAVYFGMALGRWPGLAIDRTGVALIGAIFLFVWGAADRALVLRAIHFPTLAILFALMVLSAQFAAAGFFEWCASAIARTALGPKPVLALVVIVAGALAAVLTNDVVVWAMTPVLVRGLTARGFDPRPYVIAVACSANAGSAATVIGNPQNILISQSGGLAFFPFLAVCAPPALLSLAIVYGVAARHAVRRADAPRFDVVRQAPVRLNRTGVAKGIVAVVAVVAVLTLPIDRAPWALAIAGLLLLSRRLSTGQMLSMVDWHLLLLFACLFVVTGAFAATPLLKDALMAAQAAGFDPAHPGALALVAVAGSNGIGNVPLVTLLLALGLDFGPHGLYAMALFTTLSGNLLIVGSLANIIAVERARSEGVSVSFADYARIGVPVTAASLVVSYLWIVFLAPLLV